MKTRTQNPLAGRSLTATLAIAFLALSVVVLLISGGLQIFSNIQTQQGVIANRQQLIAQEAARTVGSFIQEKFSILETTVRLADPATASPEVQKQILQSLLSIQLPFRQLVLLNAQGQELAKVSRLSLAASGQLADQLTRDVLVQIQEGKRYISPVYIDPVTSEPLVIMAVPETNALKEFQGTLVAEVNLKVDLWDLVDQLKVSETGLAYVVDRQGNLIAFSDISRVLRGENVSNLDQVNEFINNPAPIDETGVDTFIGITGASVIGTYVPLGTPDWAVVTEVPTAEAYREVVQSVWISLGLLLAMAVLAGLAGAYIARRLVAPILVLTETAARVAEGETGLQAVAEGPSEVISLARAFNYMTTQVSNLLQTVQARSAELEERTKELEASQRVTFAASERATPDELLDLVVNLIRDQFDLYHAQVYLIDEEKQAAVLRQSTGYAGRQLLQRKHQIALDATALVTQAIHTGEAVLVDDVKADPNFLPNPLLPDTRSELAVPLKREGKVIGVLDAQDRTAGRFNPSTIALFQSMTDQVAILFENSALLERVTDQTEVMSIFTNQLRTAADIARRLGTILDPEQLLQEVVELIQSRFGLYHAHIYLLDETEDTLKLATGSGEVGRVLRERGHSIPMNAEKSLVARAARARNAVLVVDTALESDFMPNPLLPQTRSELSLPLVVGNAVLGVLDLQDDQAGRFTEAERDTFGTLAGLVATAIQNARLFEAQQKVEALIRRRAEFDRLVAEVSSAFVNATSVQIDAEINHALEQISQFSNTDRSYVFIFSNDGTHMTNTHEWCAPGIASQIQDLQNMPVTTLPWFTERITRPDQVVYLPRVADLPAEAAAEKQIFGEGAIRSLLAVPMIIAGSVAGFMGFDSVRQEREWEEEAINTLKLVGQTLISALQRRRVEAAILQERNFSEAVVNSLPGNFYVIDDQANLTRWNARFAAVSGYTPEELQQIGALGTIAEEDRAAVAEVIQQAFITGEESAIEAHVVTKSGERIPYYYTGMRAVIQGKAYVVGMGIDITDRVRAETAVRESQRRLAEALNIAQMGYWTLDIETNTFTFNDQYYKAILNTTVEEVGGYEISAEEFAQRFVFQEDVPLVAQNAQLAIESPDPDFHLQFESRNLTADGEEVWTTIWTTAERDAEGRTIGMRGVSQVITERKQAEEALRQANLVIESSPVILFRWRADEHWTVELVSDNIQQFGYSPEELLSGATPYATLVYPADLERVGNEVAAFSASGVSSFQQEYRIVTKDGQVRWTDDRTTIIRDADGNITHYEGIVIDSTERKQAEAERERLTAVLSNSQDFIGMVDMAGNTIYVNPAGLHMCGHENLEAVLGKPIANFHLPEDAQRLAETVMPVLLETGTSRVENRLLRTDGTLIPVDQTLFVIRDAQGNPQNLATFMTDITERKQAEAEIQKRASELQTVAEVGTAASTILEPDRLLTQVVELTKTNFDLYHAHIYLIDELGESLVLASGAGEAGAQMKAQGWQIAADSETSLVARAFRTREGVIVNDVRAAADFLPNPLLPDTRAELAVPLIVGEQVLGVLDVQSDQVDRFTREDVAIQTTLAGQIATAIENARLFEARERSELMAQEQRVFLRRVIDATPNFIFVKDRDGKFVLVNQAVADAYGATVEALIGKSDADFNPNAAEVQAFLEADQAVMDSHQELVIPQEPITDSQGNVRWLQTTKRPLVGANEVANQMLGISVDITERIEREAVVLQERNFSAAVINSLPGIFYVVDEQARITRWNKQYEVVTEYSPEEMAVIGALGPIAEEERAFVGEQLQQVLVTGEATAEVHIATKSGKRIPYYLSGIRAEIEGKTYVVGTGIDISERVRAEAAVRESRQMLQTVMDSLPESIFWKDKDLVYLGCNTNFAQDAGVDSPEQVIGKTDHDMPWKDQVVLYQADDRHVIDTGESKVNFEEPQSTPDGSIIWLRTSKLPLYNEQGKAYAVLGAYADITEIKQAQAEIQKRATELQTVAEVGTAASTILEPDRLLAQVVELTKTNFGLYHAHIYLIDDNQESLVLAAGAGEAGAQMKAQGWQIAADSETSLVARAFRSREGVIVNDVRDAPDFLPNPLLPDTRAELAVPLIVGERVLGVLDVQSDQVDYFTREDVGIQTTLAGQVAAALENARLFQETRELDRLKGEFLANMSHELRTPLNSIVGYIQLLLMDLEGEIPEDSYEDMKSVDTNSKHLLNLINDILDLARIEAGRMELHRENIDVPMLLDTVKSNNAGLLLDSALTFIVEADPDLPQIYADPIRMTQMLNNLISNAYKFTEAGGITVRAYRKDGEVCIAVEDTGIGIAEEDLDTIFERFRQVDGSFTRRAEGTGLGLSITHRLVEMHGGRLTVHSKFGEGSTFTIYLPAVA